MTDKTSKTSRTIARIGALALAVGVVAYLAYQAQRSADGAHGPPSGRAVDPLLMSTKSASPGVVAPGSSSSGQLLAPQDSQAGSDVLLRSSKSAVLPSSKFMVMEPSSLLFSSKSGVLMAKPDQPVQKPKQGAAGTEPPK